MLSESEQSSDFSPGSTLGKQGVKVVTFSRKKKLKKKKGEERNLENCSYPYNGAAYLGSTKSHFYTGYFQGKASYSVTHKSEEAPFDFKFKVYISNFVCFLC